MKRVSVFLMRRAVAGAFTIVVMLTVAFMCVWLTPAQPARFIYPYAQVLTPYTVKHANHLLGADRPKLEQWAHYVTHVPRGDFGNAWDGAQISASQTLVEQPVAPVVYPAFRATLSLLLGGAALVLLLAIPLGAFAGTRIGTLSDRTVSLVALIGVCTHPMVIGILVRALFANRLHWVPPTGYCPLTGARPGQCGGPVDWADHLALPWLTFALLFLALYVRMIRASVAETLHHDYVRTARAKGASELRVVAVHVLPNAGLRVLTMIGMEIGTAIGVCIYIEAAFGLPGLASLAAFEMGGNTPALDLPTILAVVFLISVIVVVGNLIVDLLYALADPRTVVARRGPTAKAAAGGVI